MRNFLLVLLLFGVLDPFKSYAHGLQQHIKDAKEVFNGYGNEGRISLDDQEEVSFHRYYERFSFELDVYKRTDRNTLCWYMREALHKEYKCDVLHGGHRSYGHRWTMGDKTIPIATVEALEQKHKGAINVVVEVWEKFCDRHYEYAEKLLGLPRGDKHAKAFAAIIHCVHLLGDREPGNKKVDQVLSVKKLIDVISEQAGKLFDDSKWGNEIKLRLNKAMKEAPSGDKDKKKAQAVLRELKKLEFGTKLHDKYGARIRSQWTESGSP